MVASAQEKHKYNVVLARTMRRVYLYNGNFHLYARSWQQVQVSECGGSFGK